MTDREREIITLQYYGEIPKKQKYIAEEADYRPHKPKEPIWRPDDEK